MAAQCPDPVPVNPAPVISSGSGDYKRIMRLQPGDEKRDVLQSHGIIFLDEEIEEGTTYTTCLDLMYLYKIGFNKPVSIVLRSPGGNIHEGLAIYDCIKALTQHGMRVNILGMGSVASMAAVIMQAATKRFSLPHTQFLIHQLSQTVTDKEEVNVGEERVEENKRINSICMQLIAERVGIDLQELKALSKKRDYWLDAAGAKVFGRNGLIDEITTTLPF